MLLMKPPERSGYVTGLVNWGCKIDPRLLQSVDFKSGSRPHMTLAVGVTLNPKSTKILCVSEIEAPILLELMLVSKLGTEN